MPLAPEKGDKRQGLELRRRGYLGRRGGRRQPFSGGAVWIGPYGPGYEEPYMGLPYMPRYVATRAETPPARDCMVGLHGSIASFVDSATGHAHNEPETSDAPPMVVIMCCNFPFGGRGFSFWRVLILLSFRFANNFLNQIYAGTYT